MQDKFTIPTLKWLIRSIKHTEYNGSAAYYQWGKGWSEAYPETTGYIIPTLWDYHYYYPKLRLDNYAIKCADWLLSIQLENGAFPGGLYNAHNDDPIIFDTGQILFGLIRTYKETGKDKYLIAAKRANSWLLQVWKTEGSWQSFNYIKGYEPSYHTRGIWAVLNANQYLQNKNAPPLMKEAFEYYQSRVQNDGWVDQWALHPDEAALTHTIAYTLRGFLESAILLNNTSYIDFSLHLITQVCQAITKEGWAGQYEKEWKGDHRFLCLVGQAQFCVLLCRIAMITKESSYHQQAIPLFDKLKQSRSRIISNGGIAGSAPIWGAYQAFRYLNWAAKFYLDAYLNITNFPKSFLK